MDAPPLVVQSSFEGLRVEDEQIPSTSGTQKPVKSKNSKKKEGQKRKSRSERSKKQKAKAAAVLAEQWEEWKIKDEEFIDENFETDMKQALLLSKLDLGQQKEETPEKPKEEAPVTSKKKKKKNVMMSLREFHLMTDDDKDKEQTNQKGAAACISITEESSNIFDKQRLRILKWGEPNKAHSLQAQEKIIYNENSSLSVDILKLTTELAAVQFRNKQLSHVLSQGEMKNMPSVLEELERGRAEQAKIAAEMAAMRAEIDKARANAADLRAKDKKKKSVGFADNEKN